MESTPLLCSGKSKSIGPRGVLRVTMTGDGRTSRRTARSSHIQKADRLQDNWLSLLQFWVIKKRPCQIKKKKIYGTKQLDTTCDPELDSSLINSDEKNIFVQPEKYECGPGIKKKKMIAKENRYC